jgi:hypothetical protein
MKKRNILILSIISFFFFSSIALSAEYWASKNSNKYHLPTCKSAQKIKPSNLVKFDTPEAAIKAGYTPCKICKPPAFSKAEVKPEKNIDLAVVKADSGDQNPGRRGCCSWHGGVCGCKGGRVVCCDGKYSPSCKCSR